jgi:hypothetical protein
MEQILCDSCLIWSDDLALFWPIRHGLILEWSFNWLSISKCPPVEPGVLIVDLVDVLDLI